MKSIVNEIFNCKGYNNLTKTSDSKHSCNEIVSYQKSLKISQQPEAFSGNIERAPILVISSNPSLNTDELYPDLTWPQEMINDFFINRFANRGSKYSWVYENKCLLNNGLRSKKVNTWNEIQNRVSELLSKPAKPGIDYAFADIVHCKSRNNIGVTKARDYCVKKHLELVLEHSKPCIIIAVGNASRDFFDTEFNSIITYKGITLVCTPGPGSSISRKFAKVFSETQLSQLKETINNCQNSSDSQDVIDKPVLNNDEIVEFINSKIASYKKCF